MAGRKKKSKEVGVEELRALAKTYGLEENPLLISQIEMYAVQQRVISMIREELNERGQHGEEPARGEAGRTGGRNGGRQW